MVRDSVFFNLLENSDWRYERKFAVSTFTKYDLESIVKLHPALFSEIYHERLVNNIYLDSINYKNYWENLTGKSQRLKVRIRWYNETFGLIAKPIIEIKVKSGYLGSKISYQIPPFNLDNNISILKFRDILKVSKIPEDIKIELLNFKFSIMNLYNRKYFLSANKKYRVTIDSDMQYFKIDDNFNSFLKTKRDSYNTVLELKYNNEFDNSVRTVTNWFKFRVTRNSKYINGLENLIFQ